MDDSKLSLTTFFDLVYNANKHYFFYFSQYKYERWTDPKLFVCSVYFFILAPTFRKGQILEKSCLHLAKELHKGPRLGPFK